MGPPPAAGRPTGHLGGRARMHPAAWATSRVSAPGAGQWSSCGVWTVLNALHGGQTPCEARQSSPQLTSKAACFPLCKCSCERCCHDRLQGLTVWDLSPMSSRLHQPMAISHMPHPLWRQPPQLTGTSRTLWSTWQQTLLLMMCSSRLSSGKSSRAAMHTATRSHRFAKLATRCSQAPGRQALLPGALLACMLCACCLPGSKPWRQPLARQQAQPQTTCHRMVSWAPPGWTTLLLVCTAPARQRQAALRLPVLLLSKVWFRHMLHLTPLLDACSSPAGMAGRRPGS